MKGQEKKVKGERSKVKACDAKLHFDGERGSSSQAKLSWTKVRDRFDIFSGKVIVEINAVVRSKALIFHPSSIWYVILAFKGFTPYIL